MGHGAARSLKFRTQHPLCCYCGGITQTETKDHQPPRTLFRERVGPTGFAFPACWQCNNLTSNYEGLFAMFALAVPRGSTGDLSREFKAALEGQRIRHPEIFDSLFQLTANQKRSIMRRNMWSPAPGMAHANAPIANLSHPTITKSRDLFARKMLLSLWYRHISSALPLAGRGSYCWFTNTSGATEALKTIVGKMQGVVNPAYNFTRPLGDQFAYAYHVTPSSEFAVFYIEFHGAFSLLGYLHKDGLQNDTDNLWTTFQPFPAPTAG